MWRCRVALAAFVLGACATTPPRHSEPPPSHPASGCDPDAVCFDDRRGRALKEALAEADFEVARLDAATTDWSVYAHHRNVYVRGLASLRLREQAGAADETRLRRVVELLGDARPVYSAHCVELLTSCEQGQGLDFARGACLRNARTVSALADDVLAAAEPGRVVGAIVAHLAGPSLGELTDDHGATAAKAVPGRLRDAAARAPRALTDAVADRLPKVRQEARSRLLSALAVAPPGSGDPRIVAAVVPSMKAKDELESLRAAAAILRLTDQPGLSPVTGEPRKSAVALLEAQFRAGRATGVLATIGPAAAPLLDAVLAHIERVRADSSYENNVLQHTALLAQMGPRAARAAPGLLDFAALLVKRGGSSVEYHLPRLIRDLGAIGAPPAALTPFVLRHCLNRELFSAGASTLLAVGAKLGPEELAALKRSAEEHCKIPNHPRAHDGSWDQCHQGNRDLANLERLAKGEPIAPDESAR